MSRAILDTKDIAKNKEEHMSLIFIPSWEDRQIKNIQCIDQNFDDGNCYKVILISDQRGSL